LKPAVLAPKAEKDLIAQASYYRSREDDALARRFIAAALESLQPIERRPGIGSTEIGELCGIPDLRAWPVKGFPLRWYYFELDRELSVVRLLGDAQDKLSIFS
jgi:toxin ParE1/3/4